MPQEDSHDSLPKKPHPVDLAAGHCLRLARMRAGFSQERLGAAVGISFQQVQKYERGTNRMSLSRASDFATALGVNIAEFFDGSEIAQLAAGEQSRLNRWVALLARAQNAGLVPELVSIVDEIIKLREPGAPGMYRDG